MNRAHELLCLMINLAQMKDRDRILCLYQDFMENLFPGASFRIDRESAGYGEGYPIATISRHWGHLTVGGEENLPGEDRALVLNSVSLLAIVLENRDSYQEAVGEAEEARHVTDRFFDLSPDLLCIASLEGYFIKLNRNWTGLLGWSPEELKARPWNEFVHPEDRIPTETAKDFLSRGQRIFSFENRYRSKGGDYYWLSWNSLYVPEEGYIFAVARDITREKILREARVQNEKLLALGQLAGGVAHDFNNQLTGIMGFAELALNETDPQSSLREYLNNIITSVGRSQNLTRQLLSYARKGTEEQREIDLGALVEEVCTILGRTVSRSIAIHNRVDPLCSRMVGDQSRIQNMLLNLGINACDAMPRGGELIFATGCPGPADIERLKPLRERDGEDILCLSISDTGIGIPTAIRDRIFDPFFTTKPLQKGTGLGLSAVMGTVKSHGGYILLDSIPARGSTFKLFFPRVSPSPSSLS